MIPFVQEDLFPARSAGFSESRVKRSGAPSSFPSKVASRFCVVWVFHFDGGRKECVETVLGGHPSGDTRPSRALGP